MSEEKTHWLKNPNKNYIGHWDLPENDLILTIKSAGWENVKDPTTGKVESLRVIHFNENYKPLICNQTNAESAFASGGIRWLEDSSGIRLALFIDKTMNRRSGVMVDCVRIRSIKLAPEKTVDDYPDEKVVLESSENLDELKGNFLNLSKSLQRVFNNLKDELKGKL